MINKSITKSSTLLSILFLSAISLSASSGTTAKVAMVSDVGGINDQSFNQSAWEGLQRAQKELGVVVSFKESHQDADYKPNLGTMMDANNDLILGVGFTMGDATLEVAKNNPKQQFAVIDYAFDENSPKNLTGILFREQEGSFLVGYIAGKTTKTNKIGFIGGLEIPVIWRFQYGFMAGVKQANPKAEVVVQYANSFVDAAIGKTIANGMYQRGVDIVYHAAGGVGEGVIESAKENKKWVIGVDRDQNYLAPNNVLTSMIKRVDNATYNIAKDIKNGTYKGGQTIVFGLKDGGVGIAPTSGKHVSKPILAEVDKVTAMIINGTIVPPADKATYATFKPAAKIQ